jgi:phosphomethylpyrimidine synthase
VRIIANTGTSRPGDSIHKEILKAKSAYEAGANIITDHSITGNIRDVHKALLKELPCPISTVSIYNTYIEYKQGHSRPFDPLILIKEFEKQADIGFDLITIHSTILKEDISKISRSQRIIPTTSRGGMMVADIIVDNDIENPYWTYFDRVLDIAKSCHTTISLGTTFRPGSILDTPDDLFNIEIARMGVLVERAIKKGVGIIVEGIGHARMDLIPDYVMQAKEICHAVPYRVLSVACDSSLGRDHISSAIASAISVASGADLISAVSRKEHLGQPEIEDIVEAVETAIIAGHCGDIVRRKDLVLDKEISEARAKSYCFAPGTKTLMIKEVRINNSTCSMCGPTCALEIMRKMKDVGNRK